MLTDDQHNITEDYNQLKISMPLMSMNLILVTVQTRHNEMEPGGTVSSYVPSFASCRIGMPQHSSYYAQEADPRCTSSMKGFPAHGTMGIFIGFVHKRKVITNLPLQVEYSTLLPWLFCPLASKINCDLIRSLTGA